MDRLFDGSVTLINLIYSKLEKQQTFSLINVNFSVNILK